MNLIILYFKLKLLNNVKVSIFLIFTVIYSLALTS